MAKKRLFAVLLMRFCITFKCIQKVMKYVKFEYFSQVFDTIDKEFKVRGAEKGKEL